MQTTSMQELQQHSQQLLRLTAQQAAHEAQYWLTQDDTDRLQKLVDDISQRPMFLAAAVKNRYGQSLTSRAATSPAVRGSRPFVMVEEIRDGSQISGYLQLTVDERQLLAAPIKTHAYLSYYGQFLLGFALLAGVFIAVTFNRWRYRRPDRSALAKAPAKTS
ncbi:hypothetical protein [Pseudidiomarina sp.]|uniref:hypothetical protein n=1 Tax=Pseudidiomarina sp. TaxID=2081707 RepID=UPI00299E7BC6|nr:hypothetical protein [Pseudidiomarina sp.]MDX1706240.1 hypothetical protein [Pseudidiomarina sp.]